MRIFITYENETARYAVKDGQIYYVKLSKPCAVSDLDDYFAKPDITPYMDNRLLVYGVFVENADGYSCREQTIRKTKWSVAHASERYAVWCERFGCTLTWEDARKLAGWD